jgi:hypothetical protein
MLGVARNAVKGVVVTSIVCKYQVSDQEEIMTVDKDLIVRRVQMYLHLSAVSCNLDDKYLFASEAERLSRELSK